MESPKCHEWKLERQGIKMGTLLTRQNSNRKEQPICNPLHSTTAQVDTTTSALDITTGVVTRDTSLNQVTTSITRTLDGSTAEVTISESSTTGIVTRPQTTGTTEKTLGTTPVTTAQITTAGGSFLESEYSGAPLVVGCTVLLLVVVHCAL